MLPVADIEAGWAAIIGAFIGAIAGALVRGYFEWRKEAKLAKAGARLVAAEVAGYDSQLAAAERDQLWWRWFGVEITNWPEYRDVLAVKLSQEQFEVVSQCVMVLEGLRISLPQIPSFRKDPDLPAIPMQPEFTRPIREEAAKAYNALSKLAGHGKEGTLIERPTPSDFPAPPGGGT